MDVAKRRVVIGSNEERESDDCPAERHRHSIRGWYEDGCRCPSTVKNYDARLERNRQWRTNREALIAQRKAEREAEAARLETLPPSERYRESSDCTSAVHRTPGQPRWRAYTQGCRCPSVVRAHENRRESMRLASQRLRGRKAIELYANRTLVKFNLSRANRLDAEAIAMGYRTGLVDKHTRALAVQMMLDKNPKMTDRQLGWRLEAAGQKGIDVRSINRIVTTLNHKHKRRGLPQYDRSTHADDVYAVSPLHRRTA